VSGVYWIYGPDTERPPARADEPAPQRAIPLAVVLCPRGGRLLARELAHLKRGGVRTLVSLLSEEQVEMLDLGKEQQIAHKLGMEFLHFPLPDHEVPPDAPSFQAFVAKLAQRVRNGEPIGIHCWGSIGRAPITAAATLIHLGWEPRSALRAIESARGCPVPDTEEQEQWILSYKAQP
jgi:protein-tyrosine phosphatase